MVVCVMKYRELFIIKKYIANHLFLACHACRKKNYMYISKGTRAILTRTS